MRKLSRKQTFIFLSSIALFWLTACQTPQTTVNTNQNAPRNENISLNSNLLNTNANLANSPNTGAPESVAIEAREPDTYQANITLKAEAGGTEKAPTFPGITALVARMGDNRRMEFTMPSGEKVIYIDLGGRQLVVSPQRQQYAELNKEALGFEVRRLLTPAQIVAQVKNLKGVTRVGEEQYGGRAAIKYHYNAVTDTKSKAGNVETQAVIFVDKETGLPLRSEALTESTGSAVEGINSLRLVTEMTNLNTNVDAASFTEPTNYRKVAPEEIRQQVDLIFSVAAAFIGQLMKNQTSATPVVLGTPTPTVTP